MQNIGTDIFREELGKDIWINSLINKITTLSLKNDNIVISDIRFENELVELLKITM